MDDILGYEIGEERREQRITNNEQITNNTTAQSTQDLDYNNDTIILNIQNSNTYSRTNTPTPATNFRIWYINICGLSTPKWQSSIY